MRLSVLGDVPTPFGKIHIEMDRNYITVSSDGGNGTLIIGDQQISIPTGQEIRINTK